MALSFLYTDIFLPVSIMGKAGFGRSRNKVKDDFKGG